MLDSPTSLTYRARPPHQMVPPPHQNTPNPPVSPSKSQIEGSAYCRHENGSVSRKCPTCGKWISLGPKGGEWSFQLHTGSSSCTKERKKVELEATRAYPVSKTSSYAEIPTLPPSPFTLPASLGPGLVDGPSATRLFANLLPSTTNSHLPPFTLNPPPSSLRTSSWSAPSSPQICSTPSYASSHMALPSLSLESKWRSHWLTVSPLTQKKCSGSLVLWEPGDPATTYPFNLHSHDPTGSAALPWTVGVGERPGSLRLRSDSCNGVCGPLESCCQDCAKITLSSGYQQLEHRAKNDHTHRAYDKLNWEQLVGRTREKSDLLMKERSKVWPLSSSMLTLDLTSLSKVESLGHKAQTLS